MIIIQNPLITYKAWLVEVNIDWSDSIATNFFESLRVLYETKKLSQISKKEYLANCQAKTNYLKNRRWRLLPFKLDWEEKAYDYGDDEDYQPGLRSQRLVAYLDKFIELDNRNHSVKIALELFNNTGYMLYRYTRSGDWYASNGSRPKEAGESWDDYQASVKACEEEEKVSALEWAALLAAKESWEVFIKADFNYQVISDYEQRRA